jgi:DNA repair protein RadB
MIKINREFDILLGGGLQPRNITLVYGAPATGKTNLALMATFSAASKGKVIYVDCEGGFSTDRLKQICKNDIEGVLKNLMLIEPTEFDEQKIAIRKLNEIVPGSNVSLIIVDSIAVLYRLEEERDTKELGRQLAQLLRIARKYEIPVLMTNQVYTDIDTGRITPVGGDITRYWAKIMIELGKNEENNLRKAVLRKHKFLPEGLKFEFRITEDGIESYGIEYPAPYAAYGKRV